MMQYASQGLRNAVRKGQNALIHHGGHNGPGGSASANHSSSARAYLHTTPSTPINITLQSIRPRNPSHKLFSASKNFLQRFFTYLTTPGLRLPTHLSEAYGIGVRSLHQPVRGYSIQSGLSLPARDALKNNALRRQANTFLPRSPGPVPPRMGGAAQVGLGTARNFSSARPIFQNLVQNVPIAGRALYEVDWDIEMRKEQQQMRLRAIKSSKKSQKGKEMIKANKQAQKRREVLPEEENVFQKSTESEDIEHYFPAPQAPPVRTYLLIPLAPTPTSRHPLSLNPEMSGREPTLLPPLSDLGVLHASHSTHALRLNTLFTRLDQADVWAHGNVHCSAYSQGHSHHKWDARSGTEEGVCTILKIEFIGWTKAEVRSVIGESGSGWCVLEEVVQDESIVEEDELSDLDSGSLSARPSFASSPEHGPILADEQLFDPSDSLVLPSLDISNSSPERSIGTSVPSELELDDPWADDYQYSSSGSSSYSDLSDLIIDPPSSNGWFGFGHGFGPGVGTNRSGESDLEVVEPMEDF
ncbi:hypothetical protein CVT26_014671 [Gymnopilus dilepis]|uniref:Uncharacterized protein n=1 Tax=Gymnopilus dilepis TaxID=231916 RepID=A0A409W3F2_9AGAR|nr:hypothetical protein CVT26_014671 [Gymnopilus dilepis]